MTRLAINAHVVLGRGARMTAFNWDCPHCNSAQTVQGPQLDRQLSRIFVEGHVGGEVAYDTEAIVCANRDCRKLSVWVGVVPITRSAANTSWRQKAGVEPLFAERVVPRAEGKPQPASVPSVLVDDYREACLIADLSPKASATLARRCLQGMIRDFCDIRKPTLAQEIAELRRQTDAAQAPPGVTIETVNAMDHVRHIGNVGAHMEKDINLIVPVEAGEAKALIRLIEMLFVEWYVARDTRQRRLAEIEAIGSEKKAVKLAASVALPASAAEMPSDRKSE